MYHKVSSDGYLTWHQIAKPHKPLVEIATLSFFSVASTIKGRRHRRLRDNVSVERIRLPQLSQQHRLESSDCRP